MDRNGQDYARHLTLGVRPRVGAAVAALPPLETATVIRDQETPDCRWCGGQGLLLVWLMGPDWIRELSPPTLALFAAGPIVWLPVLPILTSRSDTLHSYKRSLVGVARESLLDPGCHR